MTTTGVRLSPQDYFDAAINILAVGTHSDLTIAVLCDRLDVSKGSFYHHFGGLSGFVEAFLEHWAQVNALRTEEQTRLLSNVTDRQKAIRGLIVSIPHDAEAAIRAWAQTDEVVAKAIHDIDDARIRMLADLYSSAMPESEARALAELHNATVVWCQLRSRPVDVAHMRQLLGYLAKLGMSAYADSTLFVKP